MDRARGEAKAQPLDGGTVNDAPKPGNDEAPDRSIDLTEVVADAKKFVSANKKPVAVVVVLFLVSLGLWAAGITLGDGRADDTGSVETVSDPCSDEVLDAPYKTGSEYWNVDQRAEREQACYDAVADSMNK